MAARPAHESHPTPGGSPFPPLAEYGFLPDCEVSALVAPSGNPVLPQAFSHLALINAVMHLIRADERAVAAAVARSGLDPSLAAER